MTLNAGLEEAMVAFRRQIAEGLDVQALQAWLHVVAELDVQSDSERMMVVRAIKFIIALLPIVAWPDVGGRRGEDSGFFDLDELVRRANVLSDENSEFAWLPMRSYLSNLPGLRFSEAALAFSNDTVRQIALEQFEKLQRVIAVATSGADAR